MLQARFGEFCCCCCLPPLPELVCSIHATSPSLSVYPCSILWLLTRVARKANNIRWLLHSSFIFSSLTLLINREIFDAPAFICVPTQLVSRHYRARLKGGPQVWWILLLRLLTAFAWLCLQHSRNLGTTFQPSPVKHNSSHQSWFWMYFYSWWL